MLFFVLSVVVFCALWAGAASFLLADATSFLFLASWGRCWPSCTLTPTSVAKAQSVSPSIQKTINKHTHLSNVEASLYSGGKNGRKVNQRWTNHNKSEHDKHHKLSWSKRQNERLFAEAIRSAPRFCLCLVANALGVDARPTVCFFPFFIPFFSFHLMFMKWSTNLPLQSLGQSWGHVEMHARMMYGMAAVLYTPI